MAQNQFQLMLQPALINYKKYYKRLVKLPFDVYHELDENGMDAAVKKWETIINSGDDEYDFGADIMIGFKYALVMEHPDETRKLTELYIRMLGDEFTNSLKDSVDEFLQEFPGNKSIYGCIKDDRGLIEIMDK